MLSGDLGCQVFWLAVVCLGGSECDLSVIFAVMLHFRRSSIGCVTWFASAPSCEVCQETRAAGVGDVATKSKFDTVSGNCHGHRWESEKEGQKEEDKFSAGTICKEGWTWSGAQDVRASPRSIWEQELQSTCNFRTKENAVRVVQKTKHTEGRTVDVTNKKYAQFKELHQEGTFMAQCGLWRRMEATLDDF